MTVSSTKSSETFACNGVTTLFIAPFRVLEATSVQGFLVTIATGDSAPLVNGTDFTVGGVGGENTNITTAVAYSSAYRLHVKRITPRLQETDYRDNDPFPAESHEACLDRLTHIVQEDAETLSRAMVWPDGETAPVIPSVEDRANRYWANDSNGNLIFVVPTDGSIGSFALDLANAASASKGAAMVGYSQANAYAQGTVGDKLRESLHIRDFGGVGDGVTDDSVPIAAATAAAAALGRTLHFDGTKTYVIATLSVTLPASGLRMRTNGCLFLSTFDAGASDTPLLSFGDGTDIDTLRLRIAAGKTRDRAVKFTGTGVAVGSIYIESDDVQPTPSADDYGVKFQTCTGASVGYISALRYDRAVIVASSDDVTIGGVRIESFVRGVLITDTTNLRIGRSRIFTASPNAAFSPGHNGVLMSSNTDNATSNVTLADFTVEGAAEHAIRVGGPNTLSNLRILRPNIKGAGGCGIKVLGTDSGDPTSRNGRIVIDSPIIEDGGIVGGAATNRCGIMLQFVDDVQVIAPIIRKRATSNSGSYGILMYNVNDIHIGNPRISDAEVDGILISGIRGDLARVHISGGCCNGNGGNGITVNAVDASLRRVYINSLTLDANAGYGFSFEQASGTFVWCLMQAKVYGNTTGMGVCTHIGWTMDGLGLPGSTPLSGITAANSSRWCDGTTLNIRKAGAWTAL